MPLAYWHPPSIRHWPAVIFTIVVQLCESQCGLGYSQAWTSAIVEMLRGGVWAGDSHLHQGPINTIDLVTFWWLLITTCCDLVSRRVGGVVGDDMPRCAA